VKIKNDVKSKEDFKEDYRIDSEVFFKKDKEN